jgi:cell division protein FtsL
VARSAAAARRAPQYVDEPRVPRAPRVAPRADRRAVAARSRTVRLFFTCVVCLAVLGVGRVALSFAVVQKSLQTDAVRVEQTRLETENSDLAAQVTRLGSATRVRQIALTQLGLVPADRPVYLTVTPGRGAASDTAGR